jgi:hypothetical protein
MYSVELLEQHLAKQWGHHANKVKWPQSPHRKLPDSFTILEFPPTEQHSYWIYSTLGMSLGMAEDLIELHVFSNKQDSTLSELLTVTASFHRHGSTLGLHHTVNFGRSWQDASPCSYGFISLPYLDGETLEIFEWEGSHLHNLWLLPITEQERDYKIENGWNALEELFENCELDYCDPNRKSCL